MLKAFTLIELLVVIALLGIISAIGVVTFTGHIASTHKKKAEVTMKSLALAQTEYKSNNSYYCINDCRSTSNIIANLLDGVDDLTEQKYNFSISGSQSNHQYTIQAKHKTSSCTLKLTEKGGKINESGC